MKKIKILWTDDEIDLLKPHILFLESKGYEVYTASNGYDALDMIKKNNFDLIFLDENMPGLSGLETLNKIKSDFSTLPVVMITKSEEENIMDAALGSKISDYLIKPVNPKQILLTIKKHIDTKRLVSQETSQAYQSVFSNIGLSINSAKNFEEWVEIYKRLVYWELELERLSDNEMFEVYNLQKHEANLNFSRYIRKNYLSWFEAKNDRRPILSPDIFKKKIFPLLENKQKVFVILIDNLRYDQWHILYPIISESLLLEEESLYCSILPTTTQYARNAIFSGLMPKAINELYPEYWLGDEDEGHKNMFEKELLEKQLIRNKKKSKLFYEKVTNSKTGKKLVDNFHNLMDYELVVIVYNFIDMLSHANTDMEMIRELASTNPSYRSITYSWFQHSHLHDFIKLMANKNIKVIITTDHGSLLVNNPIKIVGDRFTSVNLRYKVGRNLDYNPKEVFDVSEPSLIELPKDNVNSKYIFAYDNNYLIFPKNFNYYANYYKNTFQHGGISMEEMIIPLITLNSR